MLLNYSSVHCGVALFSLKVGEVLGLYENVVSSQIHHIGKGIFIWMDMGQV